MKKLILNIFLLQLFLISTISNSQHSNVENLSTSSRSITSIDLTSKEVVGDSYLNKNFLPAKISNQDKIYLVRFNAYMDEMEFQMDNKEFYLQKTSDLTVTFININKLYQIYSYFDITQEKDGFFVLLLKSDKINLLLKEKIKLHEEVPAKLGFAKYQPPKLKPAKEKLYISFDQKSAIELTSKKKDFYTMFSSNSKEVEKYVKENKLGIKDKDDLIKILNFYNTLN